MIRFEILVNEAEHESLRKLLDSGDLNREWCSSLVVDGREEGLEIWARKPLPKIIPWLELNDNRAASGRLAVDGLKEWSKITDTAIISTIPGLAVLYEFLCEEVPNMRIIPGVKTNDVLPDRFDDVAGWAKIAKELAHMAELTGSKTLVLENESALAKYRLGQQSIDWAMFRTCLAQLPRDLTIWWYPAVVGENDLEQERMELVCTSVATNCDNVVFVDQSRGGWRVDYHWSMEARKRLEAVVANSTNGASILRIQYFYGPKKPQYWQDEQVHEALRVAGSDPVIIYPGAVRWVEAAKVFVAALSTSLGVKR